MDEKDLFFDIDMEETEDDHEADEIDFSSAVVWGTDWTTETIARQIAKGNIDLNPTFQRRDAWTPKEKSKLIESLMLNIPVPPIVLAEDPYNRNHYIVIDGKQRLLSIMQFYADCESIKIDMQDGKYEILSLTGLEILRGLNKNKYSEIPEKYRSNIDNETIRTIAIKNWPDENFLYTVFLRLNTGSKKLSPQELRQALKPGEFLSFLDSASAESPQVRKMLNNKQPDKRMRDVELALRYFALKYYLKNYKGDLKAFMDETCEKLNSEWDDNNEKITADFKALEDAIDFSFELFDSYPFSRRYANDLTSCSFNRCIFELFAYYFSDENVRRVVGSKKDEFKEKFVALNNDPDFNEAIVGFPKMTEKVVVRFNAFANLLEELDDENIIGKLEKFQVKNSGIEVKQ